MVGTSDRCAPVWERSGQACAFTTRKLRRGERSSRQDFARAAADLAGAPGVAARSNYTAAACNTVNRMVASQEAISVAAVCYALDVEGAGTLCGARPARSEPGRPSFSWVSAPPQKDGWADCRRGTHGSGSHVLLSESLLRRSVRD
eukprot:8373622-Pyramimonas_sp.AAC.1